MAQDSEGFEEHIADQEGNCCSSDIQSQIDTLEQHVTDVRSDAERDRAALNALSNETRHTIVRLLASVDRKLCVCEITPVVDVSDSAVSHALSDLYEAGLVARRKEGTWRYYGTTDRATALLEALDQTREGSQ